MSVSSYIHKLLTTDNGPLVPVKFCRNIIDVTAPYSVQSTVSVGFLLIQVMNLLAFGTMLEWRINMLLVTSDCLPFPLSQFELRNHPLVCCVSWMFAVISTPLPKAQPCHSVIWDHCPSPPAPAYCHYIIPVYYATNCSLATNEWMRFLASSLIQISIVHWKYKT